MGRLLYLQLPSFKSLFRSPSLWLILRETSYLSNRAHSYKDNIIHTLLSRTPNVSTIHARTERTLDFFFFSRATVTPHWPSVSWISLQNCKQTSFLFVAGKLLVLKTSTSLAIKKKTTNILYQRRRDPVTDPVLVGGGMLLVMDL